MINVRNNLKGNVRTRLKLTGKLNVSTIEIFPSLENLEVTPSKEQQVFTHKNSYGYDKVTVKAIPEEYTIPTGSLTITENGTHDVKDYEEVVTDIHEQTPYAPQHISFRNFNGSNLRYETQNLDTSKITIMTYMFNSNGSMVVLDISNFNTSNVTRMDNMFEYCGGLGTIEQFNDGFNFYDGFNFSNWNVEKVTSMQSMFRGCNGLTSLDLSGFHTPALTNTYQLFYNCNKLTSINLSNFDTQNVTTMGYMFYGCSKLTSLDLSNFYTPVLNNVSGMFYGCKLLTHLDIRNFTFDKITTNNSGMFQNVPTDCEIIVGGDTQRDWLLEKFPTLTNIKTVAEL